MFGVDRLSGLLANPGALMLPLPCGVEPVEAIIRGNQSANIMARFILLWIPSEQPRFRSRVSHPRGLFRGSISSIKKEMTSHLVNL